MSALIAAALHIGRPFMTAWAAWKDQELSSMPRPRGLPRAVADGPSADRILLIGSGPAVGWGVASHDLALAGALARALRARTGRGAVVDVIGDPAMTAAGLAAVLRGARIDRYDAIVTTVGTNDALRFTSPREWRNRIGHALDVWSSRVRGGTVMLMVGITPVQSFTAFDSALGRLVDQLAQRLNGITERLVQSVPAVSTTVLPTLGTDASDSLGRCTPAAYALWAGQIAAELVDHLTAAAGGGDRARSVADRMTSGVEEAQQIAEALGAEATSLEHIVTMAAAAFTAPVAVVTVLGPDTQWHVSRFGLDLESIPIELSFCAVAVRNDDGMIVPDASHDPRFAQNPLVVGDAHIRYYAGVPIEDLQGRRIGALCVVDTEPRNITTEGDMSLLRGLAERVQRIVWATPGVALPGAVVESGPDMAAPSSGATLSGAARGSTMMAAMG